MLWASLVLQYQDAHGPFEGFPGGGMMLNWYTLGSVRAPPLRGSELG